jgi:hypothetical protein
VIGLSYNMAPWLEHMTDIEKRQLPFATMQALNQTMFEVRQGWEKAMSSVFDAPTALTLRSVRYVKATKNRLVAEVYILNEAHKGTPPATYLEHEAIGGAREPKPFERIMRDAGVLFPNEFAVPARGAPLDAYGNLRGGLLRALLADVQAVRGSAVASNRESRGKRARRNRKKAGQGVYFLQRIKRGRLPKGIYERLNRGFVGPRAGGGGGGGVRMILAIVGQPAYHVRFDARQLAQELFDRSFPTAFQQQLARAVLNAKP